MDFVNRHIDQWHPRKSCLKARLYIQCKSPSRKLFQSLLRDSSASISTVTLPHVSLLPSATNACGVLSKPLYFLSVYVMGLNLPELIMSKMPSQTFGGVSGSLVAYMPQCRPITEMFFNSTLFSANFSMLPDVKPITSNRPFQVMHLMEGSIMPVPY